MPSSVKKEGWFIPDEGTFMNKQQNNTGRILYR